MVGETLSRRIGKNEIFGGEIVDRREELLKIVNDSNRSTILPLIDEMIYLENQLDYYRSLPMIKVNPENPMQQKATPASKLYKEFLQQYTNVVKVISRATTDETEQGESPLRKWANSRLEKL